MNPRATGWLALATAAIAAFVYLSELRGEPGRRAAAAAEARLFAGVEPADVAALWIKRPGEVESRVRRSQRGWRLVEPLDWPGDPSTLDAMARALSQMKSRGRIEDPAEAAVYGLADDAILVSFRAGSKTRGLRIGRETPLGPNVYVALVGPGDEPEAIHMISSAHAAVFDRGTEDLRDRRVLGVEPAKVERVEIASGGRALALEREGEGWVIVEPERLEADAAKVGRLLSDLSVLRAEAFVAEGALDSFRVEDSFEVEDSFDVEDSAKIRFTLRGGDLGAGVSLKLGPIEGDGRRLAQGREGRLYRVSAALIAHLPRTVEELRRTQEGQEEQEITSPR